jgi:hypothetical protein
MYLRDSFDSAGRRSVARSARLSLIAALKLYLTHFSSRTFPGENAKNCAFSGERKMKAAAIYLDGINQGAG